MLVAFFDDALVLGTDGSSTPRPAALVSLLVARVIRADLVLSMSLAFWLRLFSLTVRSLAASAPRFFLQALQSFLAGTEYRDVKLPLDWVLVDICVQNVVRDILRLVLGAPSAAMAAMARFLV